ncbi:hypothetical protein LJ207_11810 [Halanaerobium sp. Z-7514]|uniref:SurA domain protein n=1 Tax=Halanaerobium polyolivorans TaxID=2886943 RepID=A0AAW4X2K7_9FIRM|nr:hypothetical protein [Halanaerobium polyolivorans]MCC3146000.1 hypothetical protein [Halanaerobium polyolivorans]
MKKFSIIFIGIFLLFSLLFSANVLAEEEIAVRVNESVLTFNELEDEINERIDFMSEDEAKTAVIQGFVNRQMGLELIDEKDLELSDDDVYDSMRAMETMITSQMTDTYPLGHFDDSEPPIEEIAERLAGFDEIDSTPELLIQDAEMMAIIDLIEEYFKDKAEEKLEAGEMDDEIEEEMEIFIERNKEEIAELSEEEKEEFAEDIEWIKNLTLEEYKEENWNDYRSEKAEELNAKAFEELNERINIEFNVDMPQK